MGSGLLDFDVHEGVLVPDLGAWTLYAYHVEYYVGKLKY